MSQEVSAGGHSTLFLIANELFSRFEGSHFQKGYLNTYAHIRVNDTRRTNSGPLIGFML
jgi:hypothetical protein